MLTLRELIALVGQRVATAVSCLLLLAMTLIDILPTWAAVSSLATLSLLACVEKLNSVMNTISLERDWVRPPVCSVP